MTERRSHRIGMGRESLRLTKEAPMTVRARETGASVIFVLVLVLVLVVV
jgi:hypothetical protein